MSAKHFESLKEQCREEKQPDAGKMLDDGEFLWLAGKPAFAQKGHVALSVKNGFVVRVAERDVLDVEEDDGLYFVKTKRHADAVVEFQTTVKLDASQSCGCESQPTEEKALPARSMYGFGGSIFGGTDGGGPIVIDCTPLCWVDLICTPYWDKLGYYRRVCVPVPRCVDPCKGGSTI